MHGPACVAVAGPNGAGKSTVGPRLLEETLGITTFVNADVIAQGLSAFDPGAAAIEAGRVMLRRLHELSDRGQTFAFETTLAGRGYVPMIERLIRRGYSFHLLFLWLASPELAVERVMARVRSGGHPVPEKVIRRRYRRGVRNFMQLYRPFAASWRVYDNSMAGSPRLIAAGSRADADVVSDPHTWSSFERSASDEE